MSEELIRNQRSLISVLQHENARLREENAVLKATVRQVAREWQVALPESIDLTVEPEPAEYWGERYERFGNIRKQLLEITIHVCRLEGKAVHQDVIVREFTRRNPQVARRTSSLGETLARRLRELRELGYLESVKQGWYFPTKKCFSSGKVMDDAA
ncbi:MAG: hypothetical protein QW587_04775 [Candidatus Bathyarchaeia archaeon]